MIGFIALRRLGCLLDFVLDVRLFLGGAGECIAKGLLVGGDGAQIAGSRGGLGRGSCKE